MISKIVILFCVLLSVLFNVPSLAMTDESPMSDVGLSDSPLGVMGPERTPSFSRRVMQKMLGRMRRNSKNQDPLKSSAEDAESETPLESVEEVPYVPEVPLDLTHTPKEAMDRIFSQLDAKDLTALGMSSKELHSRVFNSVPVFKYHQLIKEKCGLHESQLILNQLHGADSSKRFAIEKRTSQCLETLSAFCKAMDQTHIELSAMKFGVSIHSDAFKLSKLAGCKVDLRLDYNAFETIKSPLGNLHDLQLTALTAKLRLMSYENAKIIAKLISTPGNEVTSLNIGVNTFEDMAAFTIIMDALKSPANRVTRLSMNTIAVRNQPIDTAIAAVAMVLQNENNNINMLSIMRSKLTWLGLRTIFDALQNPNNKVEQLMLHSNEVGRQGLEKLSEAFGSENCKLKSLDLGENQLHSVGYNFLISFMDSIINYGQLESLSLDSNNLGVDGAELVTPLIITPGSALRQLSMSTNRMGIDGTKLISEALVNPNNNLEVLKWRMNDIGSIGTEFIADALQDENCKLVELDLSSNLIKNPGAVALVKALTMDHIALASLDLSKNMISSKNVMGALVKLSESNSSSLKHLDVKMNVV